MRFCAQILGCLLTWAAAFSKPAYAEFTRPGGVYDRNQVNGTYSTTDTMPGYGSPTTDPRIAGAYVQPGNGAQYRTNSNSGSMWGSAGRRTQSTQSQSQQTSATQRPHPIGVGVHFVVDMFDFFTSDESFGTVLGRFLDESRIFELFGLPPYGSKRTFGDYLKRSAQPAVMPYTQNPLLQNGLGSLCPACKSVTQQKAVEELTRKRAGLATELNSVDAMLQGVLNNPEVLNFLANDPT